MEWVSCIKETIQYMEDHLLEECSPEDVARHVHMSSLYLQRGFQILTGCSLSEYMRNRRLYLAAVELAGSKASVIDVALKYGYDTQASFDKAFLRFHGVTPLDVKKGRGHIRSFLRFNISITIKGGQSMEFRIEKKDELRLVGFKRVFAGENSYEEIPQFWDEMIEKHCSHLMKGEVPQGKLGEYIAAHHVGEFGVCIDDMMDAGMFHYAIAGYYDGGDVPEEMETVVAPGGDWAVFDCVLKTLQDTNTRIWKEWLPGNSEYELSGDCSLEWYSPEAVPGPDQQCQIWIPVKKI